MQNTHGELPHTAHTYVAADGSADYTSIQAAVDAVPVHNTGDVIIHIRPGIYTERVEISGDKPYITLAGEGDRPEDTVIVYDLHAGGIEENGDITTTFRTATVNIYSNYFCARNLSMINSYDGSGTVEDRLLHCMRPQNICALRIVCSGGHRIRCMQGRAPSYIGTVI